MLRARWIVAALAVAPAVAFAQGAAATSPAVARQAADSAAIARLEHRVEAAVLHRDAAFLDSVYAPTFRFRHSTGTLETRAQRMASLRRPVPSGAPGRPIARVVDSLDVEVHGDIALTSGRIHVRRDGGDPRWRDYTIRYVRVYARHGAEGRWMLLTHHSTSDSQGPPPPFRDRRGTMRPTGSSPRPRSAGILARAGECRRPPAVTFDQRRA